ncbi:MAG: hypothetical protein K8R69_08400 [Deltaproteobacteria bacterium]|nr:hypothetical protein [Deltaproteobacteria bacterium]
MKRLSLLFAILLSFTLAHLQILGIAHADEKAEQDAKEEKPIGSHSGQKGGIYVVGRGFKTAGSEMEKGFQAAGHGIVKGGKATGHAFKKAGGAVKGFFTGEPSDKK